MNPYLIGFVALLAASSVATQHSARPNPASPNASKKTLALAGPRQATYGVAAIHAYFYYHSTGTTGDKDLTAGNLTLWNSMIGAGAAGGTPSTTVLVLTELVGPSFANVPGTLVVEARIGTTTLARQAYDVADFLEETASRILIPLLLIKVACEEVTVTANLTMNGANVPAKLAKIPFKCGE